MRTGIGAVLLLLIVSPPLWAGNDVVGVPSETRIQSIEVDARARANVAKQTHRAQANKPPIYTIHWISPDRKKSISETDNGYILHPHNVSISKYQISFEDYSWDRSSRYLICNRLDKVGVTYTVIDTNDPKGIWAKDVLFLKGPFKQHQFLEMNTKSEELLFKVEDKKNEAGTYALISISMRTLKKRVLYRSNSRINFASVAPDGKSFLFGTEKGVYLSRNGKAIKQLFQFRGSHLTNLDWSPSSQQLLISLRRRLKSKQYGLLGTVLLLNLNEKNAHRFIESLAEEGRHHTLWFSKDGKRLGFAKESGLWIRQSDQIGKAAQEIIPMKSDLPIKGFTFNPTGTKIAVTAGPELWIYDLKKNRSRVQFQIGNPFRNFLARPHWAGHKITVSHFSDASLP